MPRRSKSIENVDENDRQKQNIIAAAEKEASQIHLARGSN